MTTPHPRQPAPPIQPIQPSQQPELSDQPILLTVEQAAQRLGIGRSLMYELIATDEIESIHIGRLRRIPADAIPTYITRLRTQADRATA